MRAMSTPYREAEGLPVAAAADAESVMPLASFDVSGRDGANGPHGARRAWCRVRTAGAAGMRAWRCAARTRG